MSTSVCSVIGWFEIAGADLSPGERDSARCPSARETVRPGEWPIKQRQTRAESDSVRVRHSGVRLLFCWCSSVRLYCTLTARVCFRLDQCTGAEDRHQLRQDRQEDGRQEAEGSHLGHSHGRPAGEQGIWASSAVFWQANIHSVVNVKCLVRCSLYFGSSWFEFDQAQIFGQLEQTLAKLFSYC